MIKFKRYPYRVGETYGMNGGLAERQAVDTVIMAGTMKEQPKKPATIEVTLL